MKAHGGFRLGSLKKTHILNNKGCEMDDNKKEGELGMKMVDAWRLILPLVSIKEENKVEEREPSSSGGDPFKNVYEVDKRAVK